MCCCSSCVFAIRLLLWSSPDAVVESCLTAKLHPWTAMWKSHSGPAMLRRKGAFSKCWTFSSEMSTGISFCFHFFWLFVGLRFFSHIFGNVFVSPVLPDHLEQGSPDRCGEGKMLGGQPTALYSLIYLNNIKFKWTFYCNGMLFCLFFYIENKYIFTYI